jgi:diguanylate cyclase (GGDEF)-like protein
MNLDLPTLMVMQSFAMASAGLVLLVAWLQHRAVAALGIWGWAHGSAASGIICLMLGVTIRYPLLLGFGGGLLSFQAALIWKAVRTFDAKSAPLWVALMAPVGVVVSGAIPYLNVFGGTLALSVGTIYSAAAATSLWRGRRDGLLARWPLIGLSSLHAIALLVGIYSTFTGSTGQDQVPAVMSLFGFIYFESIVFALGTAVFILALIKERDEAASMAEARTDSLTGIANRAAFLASAERILQRCQRDAAPVAVIMFDLDRFKAINDRHGHAVGDTVIKTFCEVASAALRPTDLIGRMGGEEFAVLLSGCSIEAAFVRADRIRAAFVESCRYVRGMQVGAAVSGGVAASASANANETIEALLESADAALYGAKAEGRNRIKRAEAPRPEGAPSNVYRVA